MYYLIYISQAIPTSGCHNENNTSGYSLRHRRKAVLLKGVFTMYHLEFILGLYINQINIRQISF